MNILRIYIKSFGNLVDFELEPKEGINIIHGENESGKSTLAAFIKFIFYGFASKKGRDTSFSAADRYINWDTHSASGYIEIMYQGGTYRIEREVYRSGKKSVSNVKVIDLSNGTQVSDAPDMFFLDGAPEEIFNKTVFISQTGGAAFSAESIYTSVENMLSGGDESVNTKKALSKLDSARIALLYKNEKGGKIYTLRRELDALRDKKYLSSKQSKTMVDLKSEIDLLCKKTLKLKTELNEQSSRIELLESAERLDRIEHTKNAKRSLEELEAKLCEYKKSITKNDFLPTNEYLKKIDSLTRGYYSILENIKDLALYKEELKKAYDEEEKKDIGRNIHLDDIEKKLSEHQNKFNKLQKLSRYFLIGSGITGIAFAVSIFAVPSIIPLTLSLFALALLFLGAIKYFVLKEEKAIRTQLEHLGAKDLDEVKKFRKNQEKMSEKRKNIAAKIGQTEFEIKEQNLNLKKNIDKFNELSIKYGTECMTIGDCESFKDGIRQSLTKLENNNRQIMLKKEELRLNGESFTEEEYENLKKKVSKIAIPEDIHSAVISLKLEKKNTEREFEEAANTLSEKKMLLISLGTGFEDENSIAEKEKKLLQKLERLTLAHKALVLASDALEKAMTATRDRIAPTLSELSSEFISKATDGRYDKISVDNSLEISYTFRGATRAPEHLSEGTKDIVYLAFRVSLVSMLFPDTPPIIIDEGFAGMDDRRLELALSALMTRAQNLSSQVLVFSPTTREATIGRTLGANIITMPNRN